MNRKLDRKLFRKLPLLLAVLSLALTLPACNAVKGLGKDIHDGTQNVQHWIEGGGENTTYAQPETSTQYSSRD